MRQSEVVPRFPSAPSWHPRIAWAGSVQERCGCEGCGSRIANSGAESTGRQRCAAPWRLPYAGAHMKNLRLMRLHLAVAAARLCGHRGVRAVIAENLLLKQQSIVLARARQWTLMVVVHRPYDRQPLERGPLSLRVDRAPQLLGTRRHGAVHAPSRWHRRPLRRRHRPSKVQAPATVRRAPAAGRSR